MCQDITNFTPIAFHKEGNMRTFTSDAHEGRIVDLELCEIGQVFNFD